MIAGSTVNGPHSFAITAIAIDVHILVYLSYTFKLLIKVTNTS